MQCITLAVPVVTAYAAYFTVFSNNITIWRRNCHYDAIKVQTFKSKRTLPGDNTA